MTTSNAKIQGLHELEMFDHSWEKISMHGGSTKDCASGTCPIMKTLTKTSHLEQNQTSSEWELALSLQSQLCKI